MIFSVRIKPTVREGVSVIYTRGEAGLNLSGERIGRKWEGIEVHIPSEVEAAQATQIVRDLETAFSFLGDVSLLGLYLTDPTLNLNDPNNTTSGLGGALVADLDAALAGGTGMLVPQTDSSASSFAAKLGLKRTTESVVGEAVRSSESGSASIKH